MDPRVGNFSEQVWGALRERHQHSANEGEKYH